MEQIVIHRTQLKQLSAYVKHMETLIENCGMDDNCHYLLNSDAEDAHMTVRYIIEMLEKRASGELNE